MTTVATPATVATNTRPAKIRREHIEEGIRDFDNCVECHRSADEHDIRGRGGERDGKKDGKRGRKDHDDDD
jgi:cytochrome c2